MVKVRRSCLFVGLALVVAAAGAMGASNGGVPLPVVPGKPWKVNCGQSVLAGRDCEMTSGYCIVGDSWCNQLCFDSSGRPTSTNSHAVTVMCLGANGKSIW